MNSLKKTNSKPETIMRQAAIVTGIGLLVMTAAAVFAQFYIRSKLLVMGDAATTTNNIMNNELLFRTGIFSYIIVFIADVMVAWGLYVFLKPVNKSWSLLTAWFRIIYTVISVTALFNLVAALRFLSGADHLSVFSVDQLHSQAMLHVNAFDDGWVLALVFFGIHLFFLGYLVIKSGYVPKIIGILLMIASFYYFLDSSAKILFPGSGISESILLMVLGVPAWIGELSLAVWLLVKGRKIEM